MEVNKHLEKHLEELFPKGDEARGKALVLVGVAQLEMDKLKNKYGTVVQ